MKAIACFQSSVLCSYLRFNLYRVSLVSALMLSAFYNLHADDKAIALYDLALNKSLNSSSVGPFAPGDSVTFDITIINEGDTDAFGIDLIDHHPGGLILADSNWTGNGFDDMLNVPIPLIGAGSSYTVQVTYIIDPTYVLTTIQNFAEIIDPQGDDPFDIDSTPGNDDGDQSEDDEDGVIINVSCGFSALDIIWPQDYETDACDAGNLDPNTLPPTFSYPIILSSCCMVAIDYVDYIFGLNEQNCFTIIRTWSVFCLSTGQVYTYEQTIMGSNSIGPVINNVEDVIFASFNCMDVLVELNFPVTDDCTAASDILVSFELDLNSDGTLDFTTSNIGGPLFSENLPLGEHSLKITAEDLCGNLTSAVISITVVDVTAPTAYCINGINLPLNGTGTFTLSPEDIDAGSSSRCGNPISLSFSADTLDNKILYDCSDLGFQEVSLWVTDNVTGVQVYCSTRVNIIDDAPPVINCQNVINTTLDGSGNPIIDLNSVITSMSDNCSIADTLLNLPAIIDICTANLSSITAIDQSGNTATCTFNMFILGDSPIAVCRTDTLVYLDIDGSLILTSSFLEEIDDGSFDPEGCPLSYTASQTSFDCTDVSASPIGISLIVTDPTGLFNSCLFYVDLKAPVPELVCKAKAEFEACLDDNGEFVLSVDDIDNGSTNGCEGLSRAIDITSLSCNLIDISPINVTLTISNGVDTESCVTQVAVVDKIPPTITCESDFTRILDENGVVSILPIEILSSVNDNCGIFDFAISQSELDCSNKDNPVVVTAIATDLSGSTSTCSTTVTVQDITAPSCTLRNALVFDLVGSPPNLTVTANDLLDSFSDNCNSIPSKVTLSPSLFDCNNIGVQNVILTVEDDCSNLSSCSTSITIEDNNVPICLSKPNVTVMLNNAGLYMITPADIDNGSQAGCDGNANINVSPAFFDCSDIVGTVTVVLTVSSSSGNTSSCTSSVTIIPPAPIIVCPSDLNVPCSTDVNNLDVFGNATASDYCGSTVILEESNVINVNACNIGVITRTWTANTGAANSASCTQVITIAAPINPLVESNIIWPDSPFTLLGCDNDPDSYDTGMPEVDLSNVDCSNISISSTTIDVTPPGVPCEKTLERTWTVTDSCTTSFSYVQTITSTNDVPPIITGCAPIRKCVTSDCLMFVDLTVFAEDDCTESPDLIFENDSAHAFSNGSDASGEYPVGVHYVTFTVKDDCGNQTQCTVEIDICDDNNVCCPIDCQVQCLSQINLSLDRTCQSILTPDMGAIGVSANNLCHEIEVYDAHDKLVASNLIGVEHIGENLTYKVRELDCGNICWGKVNVEYKFPPTIECPNDLTIFCGELEYLPPPLIWEFCASAEVTLIDEDVEKLDCDPWFNSIVRRTYEATDEYGNKSSCSYNINLERLSNSNVIFPETAVLKCSDLDSFIIADSGVPLPWITSFITGSGTSGVPMICGPSSQIFTELVCPVTGSGSGVPLIPIGGATILTPSGPEIMESHNSGQCNAAIIYNDVELPQVGCTKKVIRTWEVIEWWCGEEYTNGNLQLIEVIDDLAPELTCPDAFVLSTDQDCAGSAILPPAIVLDGCGNGENVTIEYAQGIVEGNGGEAELNLGVNILTYKVHDDCYNFAECTTTVTVRDNSEPVAICERNTVVSLSSDSNTLVSSAVFDDGSWDECSTITSCSMKMEDLLFFRSLSIDTVYQGAAYVLKSRMDKACLQTYVSGVSLDGEDYLSEADLCVPYVRFCCTDVNVDQLVIFRALDEAGNHSDCMVNVRVQDKLAPLLTCPEDVDIDCRAVYDLDDLVTQFGSPFVEDNCSNTQSVAETVLSDLNQCGIGKITRLFEIHGDSSIVLSDCEQQIYIGNESPFEESSIQWPLDLETSCFSVGRLLPEDLEAGYNYPTFIGADEFCNHLEFDYEDEYFSPSQAAGICSIIRRHWKVIDWCTQVDGQFVIYPSGGSSYIQTITLTNELAPIIDIQEDRMFTSTNLDCTSGDITIIRTATDDCTESEELAWSYRMTDGLGFEEDGQSHTVSGNYNVGFYTINWTVRDGCNNLTTTTQILEIVNTKTPIPVCLNGISISLDEQSQTVELWPSDIDGGTFHPCSKNFILSFYEDSRSDGLTFDCEDLGDQAVNLYGIDEDTGLGSYCIANVVVQDPLNVCSNFGIAAIEGEILTEDYQEIENVTVELGSNVSSEMTNNSGIYAFEGMPIGGTYEVVPAKNDNHLNGVSTLDLIKIQQHILGVELLDSPYKMIAADVNGNKEINGLDLVELRKLILGVYVELPENSSWRFVDEGYSFADPLQPWLTEVSESYFIDDLLGEMQIDFIGVKIGDVNGDVVSNSLDENTVIRDDKEPLVFEIGEAIIEEGTITQIPVYAKGYKQVNGWQTTFKIDPEVVEILGIERGSSSIESNNVYLERQSEGWFTMSYHTLDVEDISDGEVLFTILVNAKQRMDVKEFISLTSEVTESEAYRGDDELINLELSWRPKDKIVIASINPNPWFREAMITFSIPSDGDANWSFYDVSGKLIYSKIEYYKAGQHEMLISKKEINSNGLLYVKLTTKEGTSENKMMVID